MTAFPYFSVTTAKCPAQRQLDESIAPLSPLGIESTFAVLGYNPKSVISCILSAQGA